MLERFPELSTWDKTAPLLGWTIPEAFFFATEQLGEWGPPRSQTAVVELHQADLDRMAQSLSEHVSQTGGAAWQDLEKGISNRTAILGGASSPKREHAEWFTRVMNLP